MTWKERLQNVKPELVRATVMGGCSGCPGEHFPEAKGIRLFESKCPCGGRVSDDNCAKCWNSEIPETEPKMTAADVHYLDNDINVARAIYRRAMNSIYGNHNTRIDKPSDCNRTCTNCMYLSYDVDREPCKSCDAKGHTPTNWVYRDNSDLVYNRETDKWEPKKKTFVALARCNGKSMTDFKKTFDALYHKHGFDPQDISTWYPKSMIDTQKLYDAIQDDVFEYINWPKVNPILQEIERLSKIKDRHDGLSAQVYAIDELHNVKNEERKPDMHPRNYYPITLRNGGSLTVLPAALPEIEDVIFNPPATIVFWKDGTKTVVKAHNEEYDPEKGLAMAMIKKLYGNKGNYCNKLKKWTDKYSGKYPAEKADETRANVSIAYDLLTTIRDNRKMTKSQMVCEIEDAIGYLGEALE